jgi:sterol 3beta-glucosyltransferase
LAISEHYFGFWSKQTTSADIHYRIPLREIKFATTFSPTKLIHTSALRLEIEGIEDLKFHLKSDAFRDEALSIINQNVAALHSQLHSPSSPHASIPPTPSTDSEQEALPPKTPTHAPAHPHRRSTTELIAPLDRTLSFISKRTVPHEVRMQLPKPINLPAGIAFAPKQSMHFVCLTIGSRGDVQPYIALGLGLLKDGHRVTIVTHEEYKPWIESYSGLTHRTAGGDPGSLMKLSVENKVFNFG